MHRTNKPINKGHKILYGVLCLLAISFVNILSEYTVAQGYVYTPQIPDADRMQKNKVFLEYADKLTMNEFVSRDYQVLIGNVKFRKEGMYMYCDSAHFYDKTNSFNAYGNIKMEQGDTLFVYADELYYNGQTEIAKLRFNVKLINRDVELSTDSLDYLMLDNIGYYFEGGRIIDSKNELSSVYGQYEPDTKDAEFLYSVQLINEKFIMNTDTLKYNTDNHIADIVGYTTIESDSTVIYSDLGQYNTDTENARLFNRSVIVTKDGQKLTGDTLFYDRIKNYGEVFGNMILTDSVHNTILEGEYGYHDDTNKISFVTQRALVKEFSQGDTLYMHGDSIRTYISGDTGRIMSAYHNVRFFRNDIQGIADSISVTSMDSIMNMHHHPIVWNENKQVFGNLIQVHMNDSTVDWAKLPDFGFVAEHIGEMYYNQLSGKQMLATFEAGQLRKLDVSGNVLAIFLPAEKDSTYNKLVSTESSFLSVLFHGKEIEKLNMWPEVSGKAIPLYLSKRSDCYLQDFSWYDKLRPRDKDDIFNIPEEMKILMQNEEPTLGRKKRASK